MFTLENTQGFTQADCNLMNQAVRTLMARGVDESNACDIVNNNWDVSDNTIEALMTTAGEAGDDAQVELCRAALDGDAEARAKCVRVIAAARAQQD